MTDSAEPNAHHGLRDAPPPMLGLTRLAIGVAQGVGLWWLNESPGFEATPWTGDSRWLYEPLLLSVAFVPVMLLAGLGLLRRATLGRWAGVLIVVLGLIGLYDALSQSPEAVEHGALVTPMLFPFAGAAVFIAHHLLVPADISRRWIAPYALYFDVAWKAGVQLVLSAGFVVAFWILLALGAGLFRIIGLGFLEDLTREAWFYIPVTTTVFAIAVHLTDVREGLIRGVRTVALMLLSWLLVIMTILTAGFVVALPFTGLDGLWNTGSATGLLLAACAALVILINAAYQDGRAESRPPPVLRGAAQLASALLVPLAGLAAWGLTLRIGQHGLTPERVIAAAFILIAAGYAAGYSWAGVRTFRANGQWMKSLEKVNVAVAGLTVLTILALLSPAADPFRLSVANQVGRLESGAVAPAEFDYAFLAGGGGRTGREALDRLARSTNPVIANGAREVGGGPRPAPGEARPEPKAFRPVIAALPSGATLPERFLNPGPPPADMREMCVHENSCLAMLRDLDGDGRPEVLLATDHFIDVFSETADGAWEAAGSYEAPDCEKAADLLRRGTLAHSRAEYPQLSVGEYRLDFQGYRDDCAVEADAGPPAGPHPAAGENHGKLDPYHHAPLIWRP